jgi:hypothetical protein
MCRLAVAWSPLADSEPPSNVFQLIYLLFGNVSKLAYGNVCNLQSNTLEGNPEWTKLVRG